MSDVEKLDKMPTDKRFDVIDENGVMRHDVLCHATGYEVFIDGEWWNEYVSPFHDDDFQYGM